MRDIRKCETSKTGKLTVRDKVPKEHKLSVAEMRILLPCERWVDIQERLKSGMNISEKVGVASVREQMIKFCLRLFDHMRNRPIEAHKRWANHMKTNRSPVNRGWGRSKGTLGVTLKRM